MRFGPRPVGDCTGAILAHSLRVGAISFKKGRLLSAADVRALVTAGVETATVAALDLDDIHEDAAAARVARAVAGSGLTVGAAFTGRVNLFAAAAGLAVIDAGAVDRINLLHESVTIATLPAFAPVEKGSMVATVKIIPFAAPRDAVEAAEEVAAAMAPVLRVAPYRPVSAALIQTVLPGTKPGMLDKTVSVTRDRLTALGGALVQESRCAHEEDDLAAAIAAAATPDLLLIAGASAITDRRDVLPAAIERAGGAVEHFGMPVDPGNLILLGRRNGRTVLGLPGCARSPKLNGFDWVLQRIAAGVPVARRDVMLMGVGGLLAEIPTRPLPRLTAGAAAPEAPRAPRIAALVLAAGRSSRMGSNKLVADVKGVPLVRRTVDSVLASQAGPVIVVTGNEPDAVHRALDGLDVRFVHNPDFADGLSTSLRAGLAAVPEAADGALVCLGDMPQVSPSVIDRLIAAYSPVEGRAIVVPVAGGKRGNPVLWDRSLFTDMARVAGDTGARHLIGANAERVCDVEMDDDGVLTDIDTPEAIAALRDRLGG